DRGSPRRRRATAPSRPAAHGSPAQTENSATAAWLSPQGYPRRMPPSPIIAAINRGIEHRRASGNVAVSPKLAAQQVDSPSGSVRGITRAAGSMPDGRSGTVRLRPLLAVFAVFSAKYQPNQ